jgi:hypothetical protein
MASCSVHRARGIDVEGFMDKSKFWLWPLLVLSLPLFAAAPSRAEVGVSIVVGFAPPVLPVYEQPLCPEAGWMWTPGYWAWGDDDYYWVPGEWVPAPFVGALWTPPYWGWQNGEYVFNAGYWGTSVGYYGGIDYGFGYMGVGFVGGEWRGAAFAYNTAVVRVNTTVIHNTYVNEAIVRQNTIANSRRVAYNGGPGGVRHAPTDRERAAMNEHHTPATTYQQRQISAARADRASYAKVNGGHPHNLAVVRPETAERGTKPESQPRETTHSATAARQTHLTPAHPAAKGAPSTARTEHQLRPSTTARTEHESNPRTAARPPGKTAEHAPSTAQAEHQSRPSTTSRTEHGAHPVTASHPPTRPESHPSTASIKHQSSPSREAHQKSESRPAAAATEVHPKPESKPESHETTTARAERESRPPQSHPAPSPERKSTSSAEARESHPAPDAHADATHGHAPSAPPKNDKPRR